MSKQELGVNGGFRRKFRFGGRILPLGLLHRQTKDKLTCELETLAIKTNCVSEWHFFINRFTSIGISHKDIMLIAASDGLIDLYRFKKLGKHWFFFGFFLFFWHFLCVFFGFVFVCFSLPKTKWMKANKQTREKK